MLSEQDANQLYNKPEHRHILVGNWQEEQKLLETTGTHRYKPCSQQSHETTVYASRQDHPEELPTFDRVFAHSETVDPKDWRSQSQATYRTSAQIAQDPALYNKRAAAGIRTQMELAAMLAEASVECEAAPMPPQFQTNYHDEYQFLGPSSVRPGQRVMKTQDGTGDVHRDAAFLAESGILPKAQADRLTGSECARSLATSYRDCDVPVSIYSEAALQGQYGTTVYGSRITGPAMFAKNCDFSKPISEYSKVMDADSIPMAAEV